MSSNITFARAEMYEYYFLRTIAGQADCHILLDINKVFVRVFNHDFEPVTYRAGYNALCEAP